MNQSGSAGFFLFFFSWLGNERWFYSFSEIILYCGLHRSDVLAEIAQNDPCVVANPRRRCQRDIEVIYEEFLGQ